MEQNWLIHDGAGSVWDKDVLWYYQLKAIVMRLLHPITREENNESVKKHPFYCYKAQLQFVG